jgi:DNA-directed RNA polymerase specialized sigma subunit
MENNIAEKTCFYYHKELNKCCKKSSCRYWQENLKENQNCIINKANEKEHTLEEIGNIFEISRMRICQLEKNIINKIKKNVSD